MESKKVSIVVPVYNVEKFLMYCLESITSQTYSDIEILLIDDGSTDGSGIICDTQADKDPRIRVVHQKNQGLSGARNTGIRAAEGEYITFIDSDDIIDSRYVEYLISSIGDSDIAACDFVNVPEEYMHTDEKDISVIEPIYLTNVEAIKEVYNSKYHGVDFIACAKLYRLSLFVDNSFIFPEGRYHEDTFTTYRLFYQAHKIAYIDEGLYLYRQRMGSITKSNFNKKRSCDLIDATLGECKFFMEADELELLKLSFFDYLRKLKGVIREMSNDNAVDSRDLKDVCISFRKEINHYGRLINVPIKKKLYYKMISYFPILSKL